jgi:DNA repair protein RecO (recombination protein O)
MFIRYRTRGVILRKVDRREADQLFIIYTEDFGKITVLARGIRKMTSKLRAGMDVFYLSEIEFIQGRGYKTLTDAVLIKKFSGIRSDLKKLFLTLKMFRLLERTIVGQEREKGIWRLLLSTLTILESTRLKLVKMKLIYFYFLWNLLARLGYRPQLQKCSACGRAPEPDGIYFSPESGGIVCPVCLREKKAVEKKVEATAIKIMRIILQGDKDLLLNLKVGNKHIKLLNELSQRYLLWRDTVK